MTQQGPALRLTSGNAQSAQNRRADEGRKAKKAVQVQSKSRKRKQADSDQHGGSENEPPQKKGVSAKVPEKTVSKVPNRKKQLIAGQGKLTSFFRL